MMMRTKPAKAKAIQQPPIQTAQPIAKKPDWVNVLVEAARRDGVRITMLPCDLALLLGLPAGKDVAAIISVRYLLLPAWNDSKGRRITVQSLSGCWS